MEVSPSSSASATNNKILIQCCPPSPPVAVTEEFARQSSKILELRRKSIESGDDLIYVTEVGANILEFAIKYYEKLFKAHTSVEEREKFNEWEAAVASYLQQDLDSLFDLIEAANFLDLKYLLDRSCQCVANMMKGKTVPQIRELFHITNDYSPEDEERIQREYTWQFER